MMAAFPLKVWFSERNLDGGLRRMSQSVLNGRDAGLSLARKAAIIDPDFAQICEVH
jgi:hypothetical protein